MLQICRMNILVVDYVDSRGVWLRAGEEPVLLPKREAGGARVDEPVTVFVFRDSTGRLRATRRQPVAQVGEFALLAVRSVTPHGAFLDWGMEKDLLAPGALQPRRMKEGERHLVKICLDEQERPFANARLESCLEPEGRDLTEGDEVVLVLWEFTDLGAKVFVDHRYLGLLYREELAGDMAPGDRLTGYVKRLRDDGKIDVTLHKVGAQGAEEARDTLLAALRQNDGFLPLHDNSSPEQIRNSLGLSKKAFKKALGGLYKAGKVEILPDGIRAKLIADS
ncbi:MAG: S1-like domain-containing RNA-binding protein [Desulfuromonadales bacterium]|jgi:predicted RNA-binding protein (virulence factor B family)